MTKQHRLTSNKFVSMLSSCAMRVAILKIKGNLPIKFR